MAEPKQINPVEVIPQDALSSIEGDRLRQWRDKKAKESIGFSYKIRETNDDNQKKTTNIYADFSNRSGLSQFQQAEIQRALQLAISGSTNDDYNCMFIGESAAALHRSTNKADFTTNAFSGAMLGMEPRDIIESQLCARLVILNSQANHFMSCAANSNDSRIIDLNINRTTKLMRLHNETLEALNRYRRKGEQRVTVQHVNVNNGGQAVVTGEFTGVGGGNEEKVK